MGWAIQKDAGDSVHQTRQGIAKSKKRKKLKKPAF
jgi:hypothetical protein